MKKIFCVKNLPLSFFYLFILLGTSLNGQSYDVEWTSFINTSASGSTLTKIAGGSSWTNGAAISTNTIPANTDGWTEYTATAKINLMVGLSVANNAANYNSIQYAAHINPYNYYVYENGLQIYNYGSYNIGDIFRVERIGTTVYYKRNGTTFHTSTVPSTDELITDASIYAQGHSVDGAKSSHPTSVMSNIIDVFPYQESFENDLGGWTEQVSSGIWTHHTGSTPSGGTGPIGAFNGNYYAYIEASDYSYNNGAIGFPNKTAILEGPTIDLSNEAFANFQFQYHMWGGHVGNLDVEISIDNGANWTSVWSKSGNQDNAWHRAEVNLDAYIGQTIKLRFHGITGTDWDGDMAIDDLYLATAQYLNQPVCTTEINTYPYMESFESGIGDWEEKVSSGIWTHKNGSTGSFNTGPSSANDGNYYYYIEASNVNGVVGYPNKTAILESPCFDLYGKNEAYFEFDYHMYGASMGSLSIETSIDGGMTWASIWSISGNQGNLWYNENIDLSAFINETLQLRFHGVTGSSYTGDMAIDNLKFSLSPPSVNNGCTNLVSSFPYQESFESGPGFWSEQTPAGIWTRKSGSTPSSNTGPTSAYDGSYYYFTEASWNFDELAILEGPCFDLSQAAIANLNFHYHIWGSNIGILELQVSDNGGSGWTTEWFKDSNQGNSWQQATVDLSAYIGQTIRLRFKATIGSAFESDFSIDALVLSAPNSANGNLAGTIQFPLASNACGDLTAGLVPNVEIGIVDLTNSTAESALSDAAGLFSKNVTGSEVALLPNVQGGSWANGVSSLDVNLLQQHINGINFIDCPFKRLAADVDNDGDLDVDDVNLIQSLIINNITSFPNAPNWKFIAKTYAKETDLHPDERFVADFWSPAAEDANGAAYPFKSNLRSGGNSFTYDGTIANNWMERLHETTFDPNPLCVGGEWGFYIIKTGDVNGSASYTGFTAPPGYSPLISGEKEASRLQTNIEPTLIRNQSSARNGNNKYEVSFVLSSQTKVMAYQMDIQFNDEIIELGKIKPNKDYLDQIEAKNFGQAIKTVRGGSLKTVWLADLKTDVDGKDMSEAVTLFAFEFKSKESLEVVRNAIRLDNSFLETAFYGEKGLIEDADLQIFIEESK